MLSDSSVASKYGMVTLCSYCCVFVKGKLSCDVCNQTYHQAKQIKLCFHLLCPQSVGLLVCLVSEQCGWCISTLPLWGLVWFQRAWLAGGKRKICYWSHTIRPGWMRPRPPSLCMNYTVKLCLCSNVFLAAMAISITFSIQWLY